MSEWILRTENLSKKLGGKLAVDQLNLKIKKGEIYGFLGPNGAGKTTTIRMILGLARPTAGSVYVFGDHLRKERLSILRKIGSLVEYPSYYGHLNAIENLETMRRLLDVPKNRIDEVLAMVRLTGDAKRAVKGYSLGMKQRLGIAAALLANPELLILDEPTNGLDPAGILEIRELIKSLPEKQGVTILVSSHLLSEIDQMATNVGIITKGRMIFQDRIETLRQKASSRITLRVSDPEEAWKVLLANGYAASWDRSQLSLDMVEDPIAASAIAVLVREKFLIYRVETEQASLERIFLQLTGGEGSL